MAAKPRIFALIVAAGSGTRMAQGTNTGTPKQYAMIGGKPMLRHSLQSFTSHPAIAGVQVVIRAQDADLYAGAACGTEQLPPVFGGAERQDSVRAGLMALTAHKPDFVLIHDAARPFIAHAVIDRVLAELKPGSAVVPALPVADTVRRHVAGKWEEVAREGLLRIQTPQGFPYAQLAALETEDIATVTDDAALWLAASLPLRYVLGDERLHKMTTAEDMVSGIAPSRIAVGGGFDVHRFGPHTGEDHERTVRIGGVSIASHARLVGHSDADVVLHALVDGILGALADGDIGMHFPPSDPRWKGADSKLFVEEAMRRVAARGGHVSHADVTIICEEPKISPHRDAIRTTVAQLLGVGLDRVSVKATTTEGLGFTGRGEGIAAQATVTLALPEAA